MGGEPLQILCLEDGNLKFNAENLKLILEHPSVLSKPVAVVSVAGNFRLGKSLLLSFFLRFLTYYREQQQRQPMSNQNGGGWLDDVTSPTNTGFPWRSGSETHTTGINMWSEPFILTNRTTGNEIALVLMDTQGMFDTRTTMLNSTIIFAISTLVSSLQIYNIGGGNIREDDLQHLQLFTEYGRMAQQSDITPFQSLLFLVRDWPNEVEYNFGFNGGKDFLDHRLETSPNQHPDLRQVREQINSCFESLECFLMPHPGLKATQEQSFDARVSDFDPKFIQQLKNLTARLLLPEKLIVKTISDTPITCFELSSRFKTYMSILSDGSLPTPRSLVAACAEADNLAARDMALGVYRNRMYAETGQDHLSTEKLLAIHKDCLLSALHEFHKVKKTGGETYSENHRNALVKDIELEWGRNQRNNAARSMMNNNQTFITAAAAALPTAIFGAAGYFAESAVIVSGAGSIGVALAAVASTYGACRYFKTLHPVANGMDYVAKGFLHGADKVMELYPPYRRQKVEEKNQLRIATARTAAVSTAASFYTQSMDKKCGRDRPYVNPIDLRRSHEAAKAHAMNHIQSTPNRSPEVRPSEVNADEVEQQIKEKWEDYQKANEAKLLAPQRSFPDILAPVILASAFFVLYIITILMSQLGFAILTSVCNVILEILVAMLCAWAFCTNTGRFPFILRIITSFTDSIYDQFTRLLPSSGARHDHSTLHPTLREHHSEPTGPR